MSRAADVLLTATAPAIWGSTYIVTTQLLPAGYPLTVAMLRALPAGLLLLLFVRELPKGIWWHRTLLLGALNFSFFWAMLFVSAYRLPGGVAATVGAIQPLIVLGLSRAERRRIRAMVHKNDPAQQRHVDGLLAWVEMLNAGQAETLRRAPRKSRT